MINIHIRLPAANINKVNAFNLASWPITMVLIIGIFYSQFSTASLMISPTRVVFEDRQKSTVVTLVNNSKQVKTYRIELQNKFQGENGAYTNISADASYPGNTAINMIRFSPRVVTINPGKYQKIRLHLRKPGELANGEYRVHLAMISIDTPSPARINSTGEGMNTQLVPRMSFSIPVIVRQGNVDMSASIESVDLLPRTNANAKPSLGVKVARNGSFSSYGVLNAYMKEPSTGQVQQIGKLNNVAVFSERDYRQVKIPLWIDSIPNNAIIQVTYEGDEEYEGQNLGTAAFKYSAN